MVIFKKHLPRRTFLRGVGATLALPLLDSMVPALTAQSRTAARPQLRFGAMYAPHGTIPGQWKPSITGKDFEFTAALQPFEAFREQVVVLSGMAQHNPSRTPHLSAMSMWLNATSPLAFESASVREDTTLDQHIAAKIGQDTPLPSLELALLDMSTSVGACDNGYSCIYMSTISWRTPTTPLPMEINPRVVFERIFGDGATLEERLTRLEQNRSLLDSITQEASRLRGVLGAADRVRMNEYLENVREVERRIQNATLKSRQQAADSSFELPDAPAGVPDNYDDHAKLHADLVALAFQGDVTRVFTFMLGHEGNDVNYPFIGIMEGDHSVSHHGNDAANMVRRIKLNAYHASLMAHLMERLRTTPEGDGTLLDHSVLFYGSGMGEGNTHDRSNLPLLVAGGQSWGVTGNRHIAYDGQEPMANLLLSLGDRAGVHLEAIGNSTGRADL